MHLSGCGRSEVRSPTSFGGHADFRSCCFVSAYPQAWDDSILASEVINYPGGYFTEGGDYRSCGLNTDDVGCVSLLSFAEASFFVCFFSRYECGLMGSVQKCHHLDCSTAAEDAGGIDSLPCPHTDIGCCLAGSTYYGDGALDSQSFPPGQNARCSSSDNEVLERDIGSVDDLKMAIGMRCIAVPDVSGGTVDPGIFRGVVGKRFCGPVEVEGEAEEGTFSGGVSSQEDLCSSALVSSTSTCGVFVRKGQSAFEADVLRGSEVREPPFAVKFSAQMNRVPRRVGALQLDIPGPLIPNEWGIVVSNLSWSLTLVLILEFLA